MPHLFPDLAVHPNSGLSFPWAEYIPRIEGTFDASLGSDGISLGMVMVIRWEDLETALVELLGYCSRVDIGKLHRELPWQHPYFNQMWVKRVSKIQGIRNEGTEEGDADGFSPGRGSVGVGNPINTGPWSVYNLALLTIQFWRPPYFIRTDADIGDGHGNQMEYLRYVDKVWEVETQMLSRESGHFVFIGATGGFTGSVGQPVTKYRVKRRWYEIPEAALFDNLIDDTPNGIPYNLIYTQSDAHNPITGYVYPAGSPIGGTLNLPVGGGDPITPYSGTPPPRPPYVGDDDESKRFFGCFMGTLRFESAEIIPRPLQLPAYLMEIPAFANNEAISQQQYDVVFHFILFDPPTSPEVEIRGHNNYPCSGNGLWYPVRSQQDDQLHTTGPFLTPFAYADFSDLFYTL
jgi:hypothetical protein